MFCIFLAVSSLSKHTAAGQALGYYFQLDRAISQIAKSPSGTMVGVETEDDIVVKLANGKIIHEQDKSSITSFPFMPSKPDLWKSLVIWADAVAGNEVNPDITHFLLVTNKTSTDCLAVRISNASDDASIDACIVEIRDAINTANENTKTHIKKLLAFDDEILKKVVGNASLISGDELVGEKLKIQLLSDLQIVEDDPEAGQAILNEVYGWLFDQVRAAWQNKKPAWVDRDALIRVKNNAISRRLETFLNERIYEIRELKDADRKIHDLRQYVHQLKIINASEQEVMAAISDYLNSAEKRTLLAKKAYFTEKDIQAMIDDLKKRWATIFRKIPIQYAGKTNEDLGLLICLETLEHNATIRNVRTSSYFLTRGTYHHLADNLEVGWHPDYENLIKKKDKKNE